MASSSPVLLLVALFMLALATLALAALDQSEANVEQCFAEAGKNNTATIEEKRKALALTKATLQKMEKNPEAYVDLDDCEKQLFAELDNDASVTNKEETKKFTTAFGWCLAKITIKENLEKCEEAKKTYSNQVTYEQIAHLCMIRLHQLTKGKGKVNEEELLQQYTTFLGGDETKAKSAAPVIDALYKCGALTAKPA